MLLPLKHYIGLTLFCFTSFAWALQATSEEPSLVVHTEDRLSAIYASNASALVRVRGAFSETCEDGEVRIVNQVGSGFFTSPDGEVLTTATVAHQADRVWIEHDGICYPAKCLGADPNTNVALLKVLHPPKNFTCISLSLDTKELPIGATVIAISCPLECKPSPSCGYVEGYDGQYGSHIFSTYHIRTNLSQYPGEGGSPIFDSQGRCIGMVVYAATALHASYSIPPQPLIHVRDQLRAQGHTTHVYVGLEVTTLELVGEPSQIVVVEVNPGSPAAQSGLRRGDQILQFNSRPIREMADLRHAAFFLRPGQFVPMEILRGKRSILLTLQPE